MYKRHRITETTSEPYYYYHYYYIVFFFILFALLRAISLRIQPLKPRKVSKSFINVSVYLVFTTNWGHTQKMKIIYKRNLKKVYTIKICNIKRSLQKLQRLQQLLLLFKTDVRSFFLIFFLKGSIFEEPFNFLCRFDHI